MSTYAEKVKNLQSEANELKEKIPFTATLMPDVKAGMKLQDDGFRLMAEMAEKLDSDHDGKN